MTKNKLLIVSLLFLIACNSAEPKNDGDALLDKTLNAYYQDDPNHPVGAANSTSPKKIWKNLFKSCFKSDLFRSSMFFGFSNLKDIGTIVDDDGTTIDLLSSYVDSATIEKFLKAPSRIVPLCSSIGKDSIGLKAIISIGIAGILKNDSGDSTVRFLLNHSKNFTITATNWEERDIVWGQLKNILDNPTKYPNITNYSSFLKKDYYVISKVISVYGFDADLDVKNEIDLGVTFKADSALSKVITTGKASVGITKIGDHKVHIKSGDANYYIGGFMSNADDYKKALQ